MNVTRALVRRPSPRLAEGIVTHIDRQPVNFDKAMIQWDGYVDALCQAGWDIVDVLAAPDCPDSVFVEDTMLVYRDIAVMARPGADSRKPEVAAAEQAIRSYGYTIHRITAPATFDGGDALKVADTIYVGLGGRTTAAAIDQLRAIFRWIGVTIVPVPLSKVLHLKSAVTALPDGTIIGWPPLVSDTSLFPTFLAVPEESGAHVVVLDEDVVLMSDDCPKSAELFRSFGYDTVCVNISEFIKLEGCVTCLSVRLRPW